MKKFFVFLLLFSPISVHAFYTEIIDDECGLITNKLIAVFTINEYTCESGKFLPANALGCEDCPINHTCSGGTFKFNPTQSQGIKYNFLTQKTSKSCSENISHKLNAIFTPNILTLNWNYKDGTDRIEQTTCVYDTPITDLPPMPVRPGYKFMGWRVKVPE